MISTDIDKAASLIRSGEVVGIPTETVYGLGASIFLESAVRKIFEIKNRPLDNPLIVHIASNKQLEDLAVEIPEAAWSLAEKFWPGPLTLLLPKKDTVPDLITAGKPTVAIRIPNHRMTRELIERAGVPIAAPSANPFGRISPTTAQRVADYFPKTLSFILDGGPCDSGIESTIIGFHEGRPVVYRLGALALEKIEKVVGEVVIRNKKDAKPDAPGMLSRHYSPTTPTVLCADIQWAISQRKEKRIGVIRFNHSIDSQEGVVQMVLSPMGNMEEAATNLYEYMHTMDLSAVDVILIERMPDTGLGRSINDRLERAAQGK